MEQFKISDGDWEVKGRLNLRIVAREEDGITTPICDLSDFDKSFTVTKSNAVLLADAGNTFKDCPILPSELLKQRNELLKTLEEISKCRDRVDYHSDKKLLDYNIEIALIAINNTK